MCVGVLCTAARLHREVQQMSDVITTSNKLCDQLTPFYTMNLSRNVTKRPSEDITIQEETFPAAEKILSDIENVLKKDPELKSFEIIPVQDNENKSPVYHEEHSLGLASWCIQPLYCYAYGRLIDLRRSDHRREEPSTISRWLMGALLLNPDVSTFWNMKRELVRNGRLEALAELRFSTIVLYYKAKCFEAFAYRRWLVQYLLGGPEVSLREVESLLRNEIEVAGISADRYANNYHAWSHREYVVAHWEKKLPENYESLLKTEWESSGKWCSRHVSDHSGLAYRQYLLRRLIIELPNDGPSSKEITKSELKERREFVDRFVSSSAAAPHGATSEESWRFLNLLHNTYFSKRTDIDYDRVIVALSYWAEDCKNNEKYILSYPGHEALWYHRRFLGYALLALNNSYATDCHYRIDNNTMQRGRHVFYCDSGEIKKIRGGTIDERVEMGLLSLTFQLDNEGLVKISQSVKQEPQNRLSEKFIKYISEFGSDVTDEENR